MIKAAIFDCDGTLLDSLGDAMLSFNYALDRVGEPPRAPEVIKQYFGSSADKILFNVLKDEEKAQKAFLLYLEHQQELAKSMQLHQGIRQLLEQFKSKGIPMAIVTGRHMKDLEIVLKPHKLDTYFQTLVTDDQVKKSKPEPDGIFLAAKRLQIDPKKCFYAGDSVVDLKAARQAGSFSIAALWDALVKPEEMKLENPDLLAASPEDISIRWNLK